MMIKVIDKELAWQLRHKVMWPNKPFDFIKIEEDDEGTHMFLTKQQVPELNEYIVMQGSIKPLIMKNSDFDGLH